MKKNSWLPLVLLFGGGYIFYRSMILANTVEQLTYYISNLKYLKSKSNFFRSEFAVTLKVSNPNSTRVAFNRFTGTISTGPTALVNLDVNGAGQGIIIQPNADTDITFPAIVNHLSLLLSAKEILEQLSQTGTAQQAFLVKGILYAGNLQIPISQTVRVSAEGVTVGSINGIIKKIPVLG